MSSICTILDFLEMATKRIEAYAPDPIENVTHSNVEYFKWAINGELHKSIDIRTPFEDFKTIVMWLGVEGEFEIKRGDLGPGPNPDTIAPIETCFCPTFRVLCGELYKSGVCVLDAQAGEADPTAKRARPL